MHSHDFSRRTGRKAGAAGAPSVRRRNHHPDFDKLQLQGWQSALKEADLPEDGWRKEQQWALRVGLAAADSIEDRGISTFPRGELPHYAGINTFLKAPYVEDVARVGDYDAAVLGVPFDGGTTYRPGTRFGPQGIRRISALYTPYNYEMGVDLREQMTLCDLGDVFTIPANIEKTFDQISRAVGHVFSSGALPLIMGGDHSIGFATVRGIAQCTSKKIGIIHFDRHADIQEKDLDERMHTTPWFHATNLENVPASNLVQIGIGGWQVPREAVVEARKRDTTIHHLHGRRGEPGSGQGRRDRPGNCLGRGRCGLSQFRYRLRRLRVRAGHRLARAGRVPAARGAFAGQQGCGRGDLRHGGGRGLAAL